MSWLVNLMRASNAKCQFSIKAAAAPFIRQSMLTRGYFLPEAQQIDMAVNGSGIEILHRVPLVALLATETLKKRSSSVQSMKFVWPGHIDSKSIVKLGAS